MQKRGYVDLQGATDADNGPCYYGHTLPKDSTCTMPSSWSMTDPTTFLIRGESYLVDRQKVVYCDIIIFHLARMHVFVLQEKRDPVCYSDSHV